MATDTYKLRGTKQPISFGVEKLTGYIVDATEETVEGEELEVENEDGNIVAYRFQIADQKFQSFDLF